jgi:hypothetical protein
MYLVLVVLGIWKYTHLSAPEPPESASLVPEPSPFEGEAAVKKLKSYKSLGTYQIPAAKFIKTGGEALCSAIHKLMIRNKEELHQQCKESYCFTYSQERR